MGPSTPLGSLGGRLHLSSRVPNVRGRVGKSGDTGLRTCLPPGHWVGSGVFHQPKAQAMVGWLWM